MSFCGKLKVRRRINRIWIIIVVIGSLIAISCSSGSSTSSNPSTGVVVNVVAAENFWGSIAAQVGGNRVNVFSIINSPNADPHTYEPTARDARSVASAQYVIYNGIGYDAWMDKLIAANPSLNRVVLNIGDFFGKKPGDNPHLWYNPDYVDAVVGKVRDDLKTIDSAYAPAFDQSAREYLNTGLQQYHSLINKIKAGYSGTQVGATESIFVYMASALGLNLITPPSFMNAVSEGTDISASDMTAFLRQVDRKEIKILVYNSQNTPPNIQIIINEAETQRIPVVTITETLVPSGTTFQEWQSNELTGIENALKQATGK